MVSRAFLVNLFFLSTGLNKYGKTRQACVSGGILYKSFSTFDSADCLVANWSIFGYKAGHFSCKVLICAMFNNLKSNSINFVPNSGHNCGFG